VHIKRVRGEGEQEKVSPTLKKESLLIGYDRRSEGGTPRRARRLGRVVGDFNRWGRGAWWARSGRADEGRKRRLIKEGEAAKRIAFRSTLKI